MSKAMVCDRCGQVVHKAGQMREITIAPYVGMGTVADSGIKRLDLCQDCTETVMQYINNEVQMVLYKDREAADDPDNNNPGI